MGRGPFEVLTEHVVRPAQYFWKTDEFKMNVRLILTMIRVRHQINLGAISEWWNR